jgi:hypothetical protein
MRDRPQGILDTINPTAPHFLYIPHSDHQKRA